MPIQLLSIGVPFTITQNVVYALPAKPCVITASIACDTSVDGTTWAAFTSGGVNSAGKFIRCTTGNSLVNCGVATAGSGGGSSLPTAALGQVLISQGAGVAPIFSSAVVINSLDSQFSLNSSQGATKVNQVQFNAEYNLSQVPSGQFVGDLINFKDSTTAVNGATVVGGGSNHILARWNGTIWKVI